MTRVGFYELYGCPKCGESHILPVYSSISISMPRDANYLPKDSMTCEKCGEQSLFSEYRLTGSVGAPKYGDKNPSPASIYPRLTPTRKP